MKKSFISTTLIITGFALCACETVPNSTKIANYEKMMVDSYVGKSVDNVVINLGPPNSNYTLSDGREVLQYRSVKTDHYSYGSSFSLGSGWGNYHNRGSVLLAWPLFGPYYDNNFNTREYVCVRRFLITKEKKVEDFKWEGNSCF